MHCPVLFWNVWQGEGVAVKWGGGGGMRNSPVLQPNFVVSRLGIDSISGLIGLFVTVTKQNKQHKNPHTKKLSQQNKTKPKQQLPTKKSLKTKIIITNVKIFFK